ncbi:MAG: IS66 family transposase [Lachnoclostridium sp.]|nr:IS66 family transposase [Lachnoclostridium sp.]
MSAWITLVFQLYFQYLTGYFHREILKRQFLMMDETPVQVLKEPDRRPQSKSYVWLVRFGEDGLPPLLLYRYSLRCFLDAILKGSEKDLSNPAVQGVTYCDKLFRYECRYKG